MLRVTINFRVYMTCTYKLYKIFVTLPGNRRSLRSSSDAAVNSSTAATYQPPLSEPDMNLKRTRKLAKMTQDTTK